MLWVGYLQAEDDEHLDILSCANLLKLLVLKERSLLTSQ